MVHLYTHIPKAIHAVQYDGTVESAEYLMSKYFRLKIIGGELYFTGNYEDELVYKGDWLEINGNCVLSVIDRDYFADNYREFI